MHHATRKLYLTLLNVRHCDKPFSFSQEDAFPRGTSHLHLKCTGNAHVLLSSSLRAFSPRKNPQKALLEAFVESTIYFSVPTDIYTLWKYILSMKNRSKRIISITLSPIGSKGISGLNRSLVNNTLDPMVALQDGWTQDIGPLDEADWTEGKMAPRTLPISNMFHLIQLKYLNRVYYSPTWLSRMKLGLDTNCLRCKT